MRCRASARSIHTSLERKCRQGRTCRVRCQPRVPRDADGARIPREARDGRYAPAAALLRIATVVKYGKDHGLYAGADSSAGSRAGRFYPGRLAP